MKQLIVLTTVIAAGLSAAGASNPDTGAADARMIEVEGEGARYWPRWRGPSGQGYVRGTDYVDRWSSAE